MKVSDIIGQTLGHYRVVESIGAGGMGQVYLAHDERLDRDVALKVLPPDLMATETARRRFKREALALSRLNHPNIAIIYDFDSQNDIDFLVMEHVNGITLDHHLGAGPLTEREIVRLGAQIARALEEAHENGVIHRDLKPSNVMVTPKGVVKVLDFGLAGILEQDEESAPTKSTRITLVAGTPPYVPPEMLRGKVADARSDIWQLGATLYEMASGRPPFKGRSGFELGEAILKLEPAPLGPEISPPLRTVIGTCLAKSPEERYQHAGEVRAALESLFSSTGTIAVEMPRRSGWLWAAAAAVVVLAAALAMLLVYRARAPKLGPGGELALLLSSEGRMKGAALSPDGKMIAYSAEENGRYDLFLNRVAGGGRVRLTDDAFTEADPSFSPDGERIAFARIRNAASPPEIAIIPTLGGEVTTVIANAAHPRWSPDGTRLAYISVRPGTPISLATATPGGAEERILLSGDDIYPFINTVEWSPDGKTLAITRSTGGMAGEIWLLPAEGGSPRRLSHDPANVFSESPVFTADGRGLVHDSNRGGATNLWVMPLDGSAPYRLTTGAGPDEAPLVTRDGTVAFLNSRWRNELLLFDMKSGTTREVLRHLGYVWAPAFSPDGRRIAYSHFEDRKQWHIWVTPLDSPSPRRLTSANNDEIYPRFTRDGTTLVFHNWSDRGRVWRIPSQGGPAEMVTTQDGDAWADVSPDGRLVAFARTEGSRVRVYVAPFAGGTARRLTDSPSTLPRWSPDGQSLLFCVDRTYRGGIFVIRADGSGERRVTDTGGWAAWWPDGKSIAYLTAARDGTQELRIVSLSGGESKLIGNLRWSGFNHPMDVSPDGRFIATGNGVHMQDEIWVLKPQK